jgi:hypothetical protein
MTQPNDPVPAIQRFLGAFDAPSVAIKTDSGVVPLTREDLVGACDEIVRLRGEVTAYTQSGQAEALERVAGYAQELAEMGDAKLEASVVGADLWETLTGQSAEHDPAVMAAAADYLSGLGMNLDAQQVSDLLDTVIAASENGATQPVQVEPAP